MQTLIKSFPSVLVGSLRLTACAVGIAAFAGAATGPSAAADASGLVLWNRLGSEQEILNSAYGPNLGFYNSTAAWPEVKANPAYVPGVFGNALTIGPGHYGLYDRAHNVVFNHVDQHVSANRGTLEVWY